MSKEKYYAVTCKCGHTGSRMNYIPIVFPVRAKNGSQAASIARNFPRCKHNHKDCILDVRCIDYETYLDLYEKNSKDPYLRCSSIQEQNQYDFSERYVPDPHYYESRIVIEKEQTKQQIFYGKTKVRNPKRFVRNYELERMYA